jgi:hypothetical protein
LESDFEGFFDGNQNLDLGVVNWVLCLWMGVEALMGVSLLLDFMDEFDVKWLNLFRLVDCGC